MWSVGICHRLQDRVLLMISISNGVKRLLSAEDVRVHTRTQEDPIDNVRQLESQHIVSLTHCLGAYFTYCIHILSEKLSYFTGEQ